MVYLSAAVGCAVDPPGPVIAQSELYLMDNSRSSSLRVFRIPVWLAGTTLAAVIWIPAHDAFHNGQVSPLLCGILALGAARKPFYRGLAVGFVAAIKPTFGLLIPFVGVAFGPMAFLGGVLGFLPAIVHVPWFIEYLRFMPEVSERFFACPSPVKYLGTTGSLALTGILCMFVSVRYREQESAYMALIALVTIGTALWPHSYTTLIVPLCFWIGRLSNRLPLTPRP